MTEEIEKKKAIEDFAIYVDGLLKEFLEKNPSVIGMGTISMDKMPRKAKALFKVMGIKDLPEISVENTMRSIRHLVYSFIVNNPDQIKELLSKSLVKLTELKNRLGEGE